MFSQFAVEDRPVALAKKTTILFLLFSALAGQSLGQLAGIKGKELFVPGEMLVRLKDGLSLDQGAKSLKALGISQALENTNFYKVKLAARQEVLAAVEKMRQDPGVLWAQPNYRYYAFCASPNAASDSYYAPVTNWPFVQVQAPQAWGLFTTCPPGSSSVTVAVLDTGVSRTHPDLPPSLLASGYNAITNQTDALVPGASTDDFGHGTFVTGIIAAHWNNGSLAPESCPPAGSFTTGMAGVAPGVIILPVKVLDNTGSGTTDSIVAGTNFAVAHGARVLNFSLGASGFDEAEQGAMDNALAHNCVIVAASGNDAGAVDFPAAYPPIVAVGATGPNDQVACYSNSGNGLDLVAPGGEANISSCKGNSVFRPDIDILSAMLECPTAASSEFPRDPADLNFGTAAGTSAAAPFVSGAAALVLSLYPGLTNRQVADRLINNTDSLNGNRGWDPKTGYGRLNIYRALLNASPEVTPFLNTFNSPNPFYPDDTGTTNITLALSQAQPVELTIFDVGGEVVIHKNYAASELNDNRDNPQFKSFYVSWDGRNGNGQKVKTGVYPYSVKSGGLVGRNKIAVIQGAK